MSIQEIRQASRALSVQQRSALLAEIAADLHSDLAESDAEGAATDDWLDNLTPDQSAKLNALIQEGINDADAGNVTDGPAFMRELGAKIGAR